MQKRCINSTWILSINEMGIFIMNIPLFSAIFSIASTVIIGVLMVVVFVNEMTNMQTILGAVVAGFVISIPIALVVTKKIASLTGSPKSQ